MIRTAAALEADLVEAEVALGLAGALLRQKGRDALGAEGEVGRHAGLAGVQAAERRYQSQLVLEDHVLQIPIKIAVELEDRALYDTGAVVRPAVLDWKQSEVGAVAAVEGEGVRLLIVLRHWHVLERALLSRNLRDECCEVNTEAIGQDHPYIEYRRHAGLAIEIESVLREGAIATVARVQVHVHYLPDYLALDGEPRELLMH